MAQRRRSRRWIFWMLFVALIVVAGGVIYLVWDAYFSDKRVDEDASEPVVEVVETVTEEKSDNTDDVEVIGKEKVVQYDGEDPNLAEELTGAITYAGVSGDYLVIRANIDQYLTEGECELTVVENGAEIYRDTAGIVDAAATATCEGFDVPILAIGGGEFQITIRLNSGEKTGAIVGAASV